MESTDLPNEDTAGSMDIDSLRDEFESNAEWRLRRKFLAANADIVSCDRLVCLSRCFVNMAIYGCSYPEPVMKEVRERSGGMLEEVKAERLSEAKQKYSMSFVKATGNAGTTSTVKYDTTEKKDQTCHKKQKYSISFVKASDSGDASSAISDGDATTKAVPDLQERTEPRESFVSTGNVNKELYAGIWRQPCTEFKSTAHKSDGNMNHMDNEDAPPSSVALLSSADYWERGGKSFESLPDGKSAKMPTPVTSNTTVPCDKGSNSALSNTKCLVESWQNELDPVLPKIRKLACEVSKLKSKGMNAKVIIDSAANRVPVSLDFHTEAAPDNKQNPSFLCIVRLEGVTIASGQARKIKEAKTAACEAALQNISRPYLRIGDNKELEMSEKPFTSLSIQGVITLQSELQKPVTNLPPSLPSGSDNPTSFIPQTTSCKESNMKATNLKRGFNDFKPLEDFIIVEPYNAETLGPAQILRQSADFNRMLLEYEHHPEGTGARCIVSIENQTIAVAVAESKATAKNAASAQCLKALKTFCWVLKLKKAVDSDSSISKEEVLNKIKVGSDEKKIDCDNIGNKLLRKMGWAGGGVGKDGSGIAEPVSMNSVLNREGLGLSAAKGIPGDLRRHVRNVLRNYAASGNQEDLVFSSEFDADERKIIHEEARKLNLRSTSRGKGEERYLCVSHKRSADQLFNHVLSCGGETAKYKLLPPGSESEDDAQGASSQSN